MTISTVLLAIAALGIWALVYTVNEDSKKQSGLQVQIDALKREFFERLEKVAALQVKVGSLEKFRELADEKIVRMSKQQALDGEQILKLAKEYDVIQVRQRTLEKSIIKNERTINLNILDGAPAKTKKSSLLDRAGINTKGAPNA